MKRIHQVLPSGLVMLAVLLSSAVATAQFGFGSATERVDVSSYPAEIQHNYKVFANKCSECHGLSSTLKQSRSEAGWAEAVHRMQAMPSAHINGQEADEIVKFITYDEEHRKSAKTGSKMGFVSDMSGKQIYESHGCSGCHSIAGSGGANVPLDGIGSRLTASELKRLIVSPPAGGTMPPTTAPDEEIKDLVAYLRTLKTR